MAAQPHGPSDIVGRDAFIHELWHFLEDRSLVLSAERRFGKTYVIQKMQAEPPTDILAFYQDMSDVHTAAAFTEKVCTKAQRRLRWHRRNVRQASEWFLRLRGGKVTVKTPHLGADVPEASLDLPTLTALPWQVKLTAAITELVNGHPGRVVFFWDEVPWMIGHIKETEGAAVAQEVLELLRVLRQDPALKPKLRMVYTGSIGFHHVLTETDSVPLTNDLKTISVPPLDLKDAEELVQRRLSYEGTSADAQVVREIAEAAGCVPFYISNLVQSLSKPGSPIQSGDADRHIEKMLRQSPEEWELPHYDTRIDDYYPPAQGRIARDLLDTLAIAGEIADLETLRNLLNARRRIRDEEEVRRVLDLLRQDHYLWPDPYCFQLPLIRRFWRARRGLK